MQKESPPPLWCWSFSGAVSVSSPRFKASQPIGWRHGWQSSPTALYSNGIAELLPLMRNCSLVVRHGMGATLRMACSMGRAFVVLAYLAHPLPVLWFLGVAAYCWLAQRVELRFQIFLLLGSVVALLLIRGYTRRDTPAIVDAPSDRLLHGGRPGHAVWMALCTGGLGISSYSSSLSCGSRRMAGEPTVACPRRHTFSPRLRYRRFPSAVQAPGDGAWASSIAIVFPFCLASCCWPFWVALLFDGGMSLRGF